MKSIPTLKVRAITGRSELIGVAAGKEARQRLLKAAKALAEVPWVIVDFKGVDIVSASAAREAILVDLTAFINERGALPVLINLNQVSLEEVVFAAQALKLPIVLADAIADGEPTGLRILGDMDAKHLQTLRVVARLGEADAKAAHEASEDSSTGVTAWNNRLSILAGMCLLRERKSGKTKHYSLTLKGLVDGN